MGSSPCFCLQVKNLPQPPSLPSSLIPTFSLPSPVHLHPLPSFSSLRSVSECPQVSNVRRWNGKGGPITLYNWEWWYIFKSLKFDLICFINSLINIEHIERHIFLLKIFGIVLENEFHEDQNEIGGLKINKVPVIFNIAGAKMPPVMS